jgi:hypothetical protein
MDKDSPGARFFTDRKRLNELSRQLIANKSTMMKSILLQPFSGRKYVILTLVAIFLTSGLISGHSSATSETQPAGQSGIILETMNASGYTYILVESGQSKTWVAIPETPVKKGEAVHYQEGMPMKNFHSKTLNRTFPVIVFSPGLTPGVEIEKPKPDASAPAADKSFSSAVQAETTAKAMPDKEMTASGGSTGAIAPFTEIKIEKALGENSHTVAEIFAKAKELDGKTVRLRGKIVKMNLNIMGRNWLHLQDGTGDPMTNTHDLVVTTAETPAQDQVVTVEGTMSAKKDFGAGYSYAAIIESAKIIP